MSRIQQAFRSTLILVSVWGTALATAVMPCYFQGIRIGNDDFLHGPNFPALHLVGNRAEQRKMGLTASDLLTLK